LIDAVTIEDAKRVAARLLQPDNLVVTIVGKPLGMKSERPAAMQPAMSAPGRG
jgi:zinc protease